MNLRSRFRVRNKVVKKIEQNVGEIKLSETACFLCALGMSVWGT